MHLLFWKHQIYSLYLRLLSQYVRVKTGGSIKAKIVGGIPPYVITLTSDEQDFSIDSDGETAILFSDLPPADYIFSVVDAEGEVFRKEFFFQSSDAPKINLKDNYTLNNATTLNLSASESNTSGSNQEYLWLGEHNYRYSGENVEISTSGEYELRVSENDCESRHQFTVDNTPNTSFERVELYPNPIKVGDTYAVKIKLTDVMDISVVLSDVNGRVLENAQLRGQDYYLFSGKILHQGTYLLSFSTEKEKTAVKLIVH